FIFEIKGQLKNKFDPSLIRQSSKNIYYNNYRLISIKNIEKINYDDNYVYNIEVENDNSYVTKIGAVHNCEGMGMPIAEAKACGLPAFAVDYSAMKEQVECEGCQSIKVERFFH